MINIYVHFRESGNEGNQRRVIRKSKKDVHKGRKFILNMYCIILHNWVWTYITCNRGFPCGSAGKESTCSAGDLGSIPGLGRSPGEWKGYPIHYSGLDNSMEYIVQGVTKSQTGLNYFHFTWNRIIENNLWNAFRYRNLWARM